MANVAPAGASGFSSTTSTRGPSPRGKTRPRKHPQEEEWPVAPAPPRPKPRPRSQDVSFNGEVPVPTNPNTEPYYEPGGGTETGGHTIPPDGGLSDSSQYGGEWRKRKLALVFQQLLTDWINLNGGQARRDAIAAMRG